LEETAGRGRSLERSEKSTWAGIPVKKEVEVVQFHDFSTAAICFAQSVQGNIINIGSGPKLARYAYKHEQASDSRLRKQTRVKTNRGRHPHAILPEQSGKQTIRPLLLSFLSSFCEKSGSYYWKQAQDAATIEVV
jgi:hypothetical protein